MRGADLAAAACRLYLVGYENIDWEMGSNGERRVLTNLIPKFQEPVLFDVGANLGDWTAEVLALGSTTTVHAFELVPDISDTLSSRFATDARVQVNGFGLFDVDSVVPIQYFPEKSTVSGIISSGDDAADGAVIVEHRVQTGDAYCSEHAVGCIDLLKVDTEGVDLAVLRGFQEMLAEQRVNVVQFEHGSISADRGTRLLDFYELLTPLGYRIGKIYPRYVDFKPHGGQRDEEFVGLNYLAVLADRDDLTTAVSR